MAFGHLPVQSSVVILLSLMQILKFKLQGSDFTQASTMHARLQTSAASHSHTLQLLASEETSSFPGLP